MRWLLLGLLISVGALVFAAGALTRFILRQRKAMSAEFAHPVPEEPAEPVPEEVDAL